MRHQAQQATHPDGRYAVWNGRTYRAQTSDGAVLLIAPPDAEPQEDFDHRHDGAPARLVPAEDVPQTFTIHTHCLFDDEVFALADQSAGELALRWTGRDEVRAAELGLAAIDDTTGFGTTATPEAIEALWQERHDTAGDAAGAPAAVDVQALLRRIGGTLKRLRPEGGAAVAAQFRQVGTYAELELRGVVGEVSYSLCSPPLLGHLFGELRAAMYQQDKGSWFQGTFTLTEDNRFDFDYDSSSQPDWRRAPDEDGRPTARAFAAELTRYPRERDQVPPWLAARAGLPLGVEFRHARVVDINTPGARPVVNRPPVPPQEVPAVLAYLYRAPVVQVGEGPQPDLFAPRSPPDVPHVFHTDGTWIWPAAVPHYLRKHRVPPEHGLLEHIRARGYRPPFVGERMRETATAELDGRPFPPQTAADLGEHDAVGEVERDAGLRATLRAAQVLTLLHKRLDELGIASTAYRIGAVAEEAWCLRRTPEGWEVAWHAAGRAVNAVRFTGIQAAAAHLLGVLAFHPTRALRAPDPEEDPTDWAINPLPGEPPLTFFRSRRVVVLPPGTELVRFGTEAGNLTHEASVRFSETSLLPDRERERHSYRVLRPLRVLTGVTLPRGGMPGGAPAYLLPRSVSHHRDTGALERVLAVTAVR
ncbi:MAG: TNT domain-containing protein [Pseudonocardiaceae bacterium]